MKYAAELAVDAMEKSAVLPLIPIALGALKIAPWVLAGSGLATYGLNKLTGYDPKKKIQQAQMAAEGAQPGMPPGAPGMAPPGMMPPGTPGMMPPMQGMMPPPAPAPWMFRTGQGLHAYRMGM